MRLHVRSMQVGTGIYIDTCVGTNDYLLSEILAYVQRASSLPAVAVPYLALYLTRVGGDFFLPIPPAHYIYS
jgi:hypothetical protein